MTLEQQVCSLELAQKLKELGVRQESLFYWQEYMETKISCVFGRHRYFNGTESSAFTVAELGEMLPTEVLGELTDMLPTRTISGGFRVNLDDEGMLYAGKSEADARAKMLIYLLENKLITL